MVLRKVVRYDFTDGSDVEFIPSTTKGVLEVWLNGVKVALMEGAAPSEARACYYHEIYGQDLETKLSVVEPRPSGVPSLH